MRPRYQTAANLADEERIATLVAECWGTKGQVKLPEGLYALDRALLGRTSDKHVSAFLEIKVRDLPFGFGDGFWLSVHKVEAARSLAAASGLPCFIVVEFNDGIIRWMNFAKAPSGVVMAGNMKRNDGMGDIEPLAVFPWAHWSPLVRLRAVAA